MSLFVREGFDRRAAIREEYEDLFWAQYEAAELATNGRMLNRRGVAAGIDPVQLFRANIAFRSVCLRQRGAARLLGSSTTPVVRVVRAGSATNTQIT